ncbi:hypothetical protein Tco_1381566, partial [Tanacetum coccineum]
MDPNTSTGRIFLSEENHISLNDGVESNGEWDAPKYNDTSTLISNEFAVKLCLEHEVKNGDKVIKKELIVAQKGEIYFVKFIINPEGDDIELGVMLGRSLLRLTKGIADFRNRIITILPELDPFLDNSDKSDDSGDDLVDILEGIDLGDIPKIEGIDEPPCHTPRFS